ncbi:MAG TPA: bifunctional phosphopantothenoylcysteine decarboxylase/phosphopantothenate--cysteine ligase CoaBC [Chloroflexota bacterium]
MPARIVLGVTGSIAAYKAATVASNLIKDGHEVRVILTLDASRFVSALTFEALTANPVARDIWDEQPGTSRMGHLELARWADLIVVAPATAHSLARLSLGLADDLLGAVLLAATSPVILAPAMETQMWTNAVTQEHVGRLKVRGYLFVGPETGRLASGISGLGRMAEPQVIGDEIGHRLRSKSDLKDFRVLVTAGPTREAIDPVRYIGNRSSGKMGYAVAEEASSRGARVTLITGPTSLPFPSVAEVVNVESTDEMREAVLRRAGDQDVFVMAAAVADFRPVELNEKKVKRNGEWTLDLAPTEDIAAAAALAAPRAIHIGFALESEDLLGAARRKLQRKRLNMVVANAISDDQDPFGADNNQVAFVLPDRVVEMPMMSKKKVASRLLDEVRLLLYDGRGPEPE